MGKREHSQIAMSTQKFIRDVGIIGITQVLSNLGAFFLLPIITKTLGTYDYGTWAQISITVSLLSPLALLGLQMAFVRFLAAEKDAARIREVFFSIFFFVFFTGMLVSVLVFALSDFLAVTVFSDIATSYYIKAGSFLILLSVLDQISLFYFRISRRIHIFGLLSLFQTFGRLFLILALLLVGFGLLGVIGATLVVQSCIVILSLILIIRQIGFAIPKFEGFGELIKYGAPLTPNSLIRWITDSSDRYIIGIFLGLSAVGIYSASYAIGSLVHLFIAPIQFILFPELSRLYDEERVGDVKNYLSSSLRYFLLIAIPAVTGLTVLAKPFLMILTTPAFVIGSIIIPFIALSGLLGGVFQIVINITHLVKKTQFNLFIHILAAVSNLVLNIVLIPFIGILGAAIATLASYALMVIVGICISFRDLSFDPGYGFILKCVVASGIMAAILLVFNPNNILYLLCTVGIGIIIYFFLMVIMKGLGRKEFNLVKGMIIKL